MRHVTQWQSMNMAASSPGGMNIVMTISIVASILLAVILGIFIIVCAKKHKNRQVRQAAFDVSLCEYCTVCDGEILK